ncbi:MAG: hypothetical protein CL609_24950 [Anaerolineaceae bacterium]|nr:hypothetical protein [Anaerolineaceae bacterium]
MNKTLLLSKFIMALAIGDEFSSTYIHKQTGELIEISVEASEMFEHIKTNGWGNYSQWEYDAIKKVEKVKSDPSFIKIPSKFDLHEYRMMEDFISTIQNLILQDEFHHTIQGKGAFQRFRNKLIENGLENDWQEYKKEELAKFSRNWLRENKIIFNDDIKR